MIDRWLAERKKKGKGTQEGEMKKREKNKANRGLRGWKGNGPWGRIITGRPVYVYKCVMWSEDVAAAFGERPEAPRRLLGFFHTLSRWFLPGVYLKALSLSLVGFAMCWSADERCCADGLIITPMRVKQKEWDPKKDREAPRFCTFTGQKLLGRPKMKIHLVTLRHKYSHKENDKAALFLWFPTRARDDDRRILNHANISAAFRWFFKTSVPTKEHNLSHVQAGEFS